MCRRIKSLLTFTKKLTNFRRFSSLSDFIHLNDDVRIALENEKPVIALESTIITHGLPFPHNYQTALSVESTVRKHGVTPATIAVMNGKIHIGLNREEIEFLAKSKEVVKASKRDIPYCLSKSLSGGTTVSGTIALAYKVGIPIFVTGGIGGVHRGYETSFDISTDLTELGKTPITVICAGIKSILDIGKTLEYLETQGVSVLSYGPSLSFPAFFTSHSGHTVPGNVNSPLEAAQLIEKWQQLRLDSGMLIAVPIPEEKSLDNQMMESVINEALETARKTGISGKEVTPFLLKRVNELTSGATLEANIALIQNNAAVGSQIAAELYQLRSTHGKSNFHPTSPNTTFPNEASVMNKQQSTPVVIGGSNVDFLVQVLQHDVKVGNC